MLTTLAVLSTGVMLLVKDDGPNGGGSWIQLHHEAFLLWARPAGAARAALSRDLRDCL